MKLKIFVKNSPPLNPGIISGMTIIFDGREYASEKEKSLGIRVLGLKSRGVYPKLASIIIGDDPASVLYVNLKKKAAERIGAELDIYKFREKTSRGEVIALINTLNDDKNVSGIMVQLPLPEKIQMLKMQIINSIDPQKDVDGLRGNSLYLHPTAKAVMQAIEKSKTNLKNVYIFGEKGMVGSSLVKELKKQNYKFAFDSRDADILISATGHPGLVTADMVKSGAVVIDVGSPIGDVDFESVSKKAGFITPVPGGIGPVTISCLLENLISAC